MSRQLAACKLRCTACRGRQPGPLALSLLGVDLHVHAAQLPQCGSTAGAAGPCLHRPPCPLHLTARTARASPCVPTPPKHPTA